MLNFELVYSDILAEGYRLEIETYQDYGYVWTIQFLFDNGDSWGSKGDGIWYKTQAACEAAGRLYYLMEYKD